MTTEPTPAELRQQLLDLLLVERFTPTSQTDGARRLRAAAREAQEQEARFPASRDGRRVLRVIRPDEDIA